MHCNPFGDDEFDRRLAAFRQILAARELDAAIVTSPENVFYFTGLDHWGYFAPHMLLVGADGPPVLVTRLMERVAVKNMVRTAEFVGHEDGESAADVMVRLIRDRRLAGRRIGLEYDTAGLSYALGRSLTERVESGWEDVSGVVDEMRHVKSPEEQALMRAAAAVSDAATQAAIAAIKADAQERDVAAECLAAMIRAGGDPPGFGPFLRPQHRLGEEHTTWGGGVYRQGETVFLEIAGCCGRYHAPNGRLIHVGEVPDRDAEMAALAVRAFDAALAALRPGARARDVYAAWQGTVDEAGLARYRRHHCGYVVGIALPPSWTGGNFVTGLRHDSDVEIKTGMSFHLMSWLMGTGRGDFFVSNTVLLGEGGPEVLTGTAMGPTSV